MRVHNVTVYKTSFTLQNTHYKFINLILHILDVDHTHALIHNILYYMYAFWGKDTSVLQRPSLSRPSNFIVKQTHMGFECPYT